MLPDSARRTAAVGLPGFRVGELLLARWRIVVLSLLVAVAACARLYGVAGNPSGFFADEASYGLNSHLLLTTGRDEFGRFLPLFFRAFGEYKLPVYIYAEIPFIAVLGKTELAVRASAAFFGSLTVLTTYLLAKEMFKREVPAIASAACLAILPWHVHYSRTGFGEVVMLPLVFTLAMYLLLRALQDQRLIPLAAVAIGVCFYTYRPAWITLPPLLLVFGAVYWRDVWAFRGRWLAGGAILLAMALPIAYHLFLSGADDRSSQASIFRIEREGMTTFDLFVEFYRSYFTTDFLFARGDNGFILRHYLPDHGQLYWMQLPLILAGLGWILVRFRRDYVLVLALLVLYPVAASLSDSSPISTRSILGTIAYSLVTGAGVWAVIELAGRLVPAGSRVAATAALVGLISLAAAYSFGGYTLRYHEDYPGLSAGYWGWQEGPEEIISRFVGLQDQYDELYMDGMFNAPGIFIRFYAEGACPKCRIGDSESYQEDRRQLFALRPENLKTAEYDYVHKDNLFYPDGSLAFVFVEIAGRR
jgi:4-amino-4-deoxy-L-arabinose transferase-like glycosyltransferase